MRQPDEDAGNSRKPPHGRLQGPRGRDQLTFGSGASMAERVVVIEPMGVGGISHYTYCLCQALQAEGLNVSLITTGNYELIGQPRAFRVYPVLREWFRPDDPSTISRGVPRPSPIAVACRRLRVAREMFQVLFIVLRERASIVHLQWPVGPHDWLYLAALRLLRRRIVYTAHDVLPHEHTSDDAVRLQRLVRYVDRVILHSHENGRAFRRTFGDAARSLYIVPHGNYFFFPGAVRSGNGDARTAVGVPRESRIILFFGAIRPYKGLGDLVAAFSLVRQQVPAARLLIAGYPFEDFGPYREAIAGEDLEDCVTTHLGYHPMSEVAKFFEAADVAVLPYRTASQSGIAQLAFAFGVPIVATRTGGLPEVIENGRTGLLVDPGDQRGLAEAITRLLEDPSLCRAMSERAKQRAATQYSWSRVARLTRAIYDGDTSVQGPASLQRTGTESEVP